MAATSIPSSEPPQPSPTGAEPATGQHINAAPPNYSKRHGGLHDSAAAEPLVTATTPENAPDAFETSQENDGDGGDGLEPGRGSVDLDDLPIELVSLTDSFVESLTSKVHKTPPTIDKVAQLFQDFYQVASNHVSTHISAIASRRSRATSPAASSRPSPANRLRVKAAALGGKEKTQNHAISEAEQQLMTVDELADKKRARKALEAKRVMLEEAVERRLCEGLYNRIYRHRSTHDEAQDDKLRSKTAALAVVGIGPADLGIDLGEDVPEGPAAASQKGEEIRQWLNQARNNLILMNEKRYPLGKLNQLKAAHRSIVDTLAHFHPSASADEIMPMLIYTLITLPPESLHVISDVRFIQRFRWEPKLTGEAAYCLTNLEAAISFLETVDLSTLRADELPQGRPKEGVPGSPKTDTFPPAFPSSVTQSTDGTVATSSGSATTSRSPPPSSAASSLRAAMQARNRRLSELVNTPAQAFGVASDAVFTTADQGLKNITNSLGDSYKFLLGKLRETQGAPTVTGHALVVPKTLDDARKLVSTPPLDEEGQVGRTGSFQSTKDLDGFQQSTQTEDALFGVMSGKKAPVREHSANGLRKKMSIENSKEKPVSVVSSSANPTNPLENAVRSFGNSFNPMAKLSSMAVMRGFGRAATPHAAPSKDDSAKSVEGGDLGAAFPDIAPALPPKEIPRIKPPNQRFVELQNPGDLKLSEVLELLRDYRRLSNALKERGAFEASL
ncbi:hypothetical protein SODALDRAFT_329839 [Sodiomyces alkalinus F11]|uniref:VPS9 domain-containing protein n=1 Tax=Sodiomyces alkalinus (strain CBS 110278 / VKM F-3762 / F11) TaxID=1314773 RepID=A0A3N2Q0E9_SODAK|nr:hypothetical protein SODALDRAFT_329839 [Sodiomyces alkalinus F11]ROT40168.1 hypothetical protein SODALDRAFT_329839 [Sodiomyces alkalinus F11]